MTYIKNFQIMNRSVDLIKRIIRRLKYRVNSFLYRFKSKEHNIIFVYENDDHKDKEK